MARNRKSKASKQSSNKGEMASKPLVDIPEAEQWRIIKDSAILASVPRDKGTADAGENDEEDGMSPLSQEIFDATTLIIPHSFLLMMMEILIHYQYGRHPTYTALSNRMISGVPSTHDAHFFPNRYKYLRQMQAGFFFLSITVGSRLVYILNNASWTVNMKQAPPLATVWVYTIVQLNLLPAVLSLVTVYGWLWYKGYKIFF
ncbi:hypothetical protein K474DRAFT_1683073 [Panus rudis PR-1116 ss-1]|nr:hypothetical protein K474DRAFT_1683073 [Panus rudis PR-1116 ss-1]